MKASIDMVEPPTSDKMEEKCGIDTATNKTTVIINVRVTRRFHVKSLKK